MLGRISPSGRGGIQLGFERRWARAFVPFLMLFVCAFGGSPPGDISGQGEGNVTCPAYDLVANPLPHPLPAADTTSVGALSGSFSVSSAGSATYTLPLTVAPGRAGMEPRLAVSYDSSAGQGIMGQGFALTGLSAISRCPANLAQDGYISAVLYTPGDHFCLEGARLVPVLVEQDDGAGGTVQEYHTFPDRFAKVLARYPAGWDRVWGPQSFEVWQKNGRIQEYGTAQGDRG